jgi:hypothetical protein
MIVPDDKNWTWVLDRRCPDCGFDASTCTFAEVADLVRANAARWGELLGNGAIHAARPDPAVWSPLEYACHVRDVYERYDDRISLMLTEWNPLYPNWDQDVTAVADRYEEQDPAAVVRRLLVAAGAMATRLEGIDPKGQQRPGRRGDGALFTVDTLARYMVHDPIHHMWDVTIS